MEWSGSPMKCRNDSKTDIPCSDPVPDSDRQILDVILQWQEAVTETLTCPSDRFEEMFQRQDKLQRRILDYFQITPHVQD